MSRDSIDYFFATLDLNLSMGKDPLVAIEETVGSYGRVYHPQEQEKAQSYWDNLREEANRINKLLQEKPKEYKLGYFHNPGSILNAYREGDITWGGAVRALEEWKNMSEINR